MSETLKWHLRFLELAKLVASWSKDRSTQVGSVAIGPNREILSVGYNGFPRGVNDDIEKRHERPLKYAFTEHSERNLFFNATRIGVSLNGSNLYCTHFPCSDCARGIIQTGINKLFFLEDRSEEAKKFRERTFESSICALAMLQEAGVPCYIVNPNDIREVTVEDLQP